MPALERGETLASALRGHDADAIILTPPGEGESLDALGLLYDHPSTMIITLEQDGRTAAVRRLLPEISFLLNVSVEALAASVLSACDASEPDPRQSASRDSAEGLDP